MAKKGDADNLKVKRILEDRVIIKPLDIEEKEKKSAAGIIIPVNIEEEKTDSGVVVAVGEGKVNDDGDLIPMNVKVGDKVLFEWGDKKKIDGEEYFTVRQSSIIAILK